MPWKSAEADQLGGTVEVDESYVGGKPRKRAGSSKRGRGTSKQPVVASVERGGRDSDPYGTLPKCLPLHWATSAGLGSGCDRTLATALSVAARLGKGRSAS